MSPGRYFDFFNVPLGAVAGVTHEAILLIDSGQTVRAINAAGMQMFGCTQAEIIGAPLDSLIPASERGAHADHVKAFDESGRHSLGGMGRSLVRAVRRNGEEFAVDASISRIEVGPEESHNHGFVVVLRDRSVEADLRAAVELMGRRVGAVLDAMPAAMWIVEAGRITFANRASAALFGWEHGSELVGRSTVELLGDSVHTALKSRRAAEAGADDAAVAAHGTIVRRDGTRREVEVASVGLPDHGQTVLQMVITDVTERESDLLEHRRHRDTLRALSNSVVRAREEERKRIARELHDELGQHLTALKMELSTLLATSKSTAGRDRLDNAIDLIDATVAAVRRIASDLRPLALDDLGLNAAIEGLARDAARRMEIEVTVSLGTKPPALSDAASIALYRIVQEALTNVGRHARATDARIEMRVRNDELVMTIRDNGVGFPKDALKLEGRFGLIGARERASMLGGRFEIDNPPGGGGRITVRLPLHLAQPALNATA